MSSIAPLGGPTSRPQLRFVFVLFLAAFIVRLWAVAAWTGLSEPPRPGSDESEYDAIAWNLASGEGYQGYSPDVVNDDGSLREHSTAYRPPTTPFFYAAVYSFVGHDYALAHVADSLLASLTVVLILVIANRVFGRSAAWLAAGFYAFYPLAIYYNLTLLSETQGAFLVCLYVWFSLLIKEVRGALWSVAAGMTLGALLLCKPGFVFLIPLMPVWAIAVCRRDFALWRRAAIIPVAAGLVVLPWVIRNYHEFGSFIPFSTGGGSLLLQANNRIVVSDPKYHGYAVWDTSLPEYASALRAPNDEVERDATAKRLAVKWLRDHPDKWFYLARGKFWRLWTPDYVGVRNQELAWVVWASYGLVLLAYTVFVVPVAYGLWHRRDPGLILLFPILATVAMALIFHGQHRYRFPIDSLCIVIAAGGVSRLAQVLFRPAAGKTSDCHANKARVVWGMAAFVLLGGVLTVASVFDKRRIDGYRDDLSRERVKIIENAVTSYKEKTGKLPERLEVLVPEFLPNVEALHCPTHSLEYPDYLLLGSRDAGAAAQLVSYRIEELPGPGQEFRIVQTRGTSSNRKSQIGNE